jgi:hypothetical protein
MHILCAMSNSLVYLTAMSIATSDRCHIQCLLIMHIHSEGLPRAPLHPLLPLLSMLCLSRQATQTNLGFSNTWYCNLTTPVT